MSLLYNNYLVSCDCVYSHKYTSLYQFKDFGFVDIKFPVTSFSSIANYSLNKKNNSIDFNANIFLLFYIYFVNKTLITYCETKDTFSYFINLIKKKNIFIFLTNHYGNLNNIVKNYLLKIPIKLQKKFFFELNLFSSYKLYLCTKEIVGFGTFQHVKFFLNFEAKRL
jgi:hypothetical protein